MKKKISLGYQWFYDIDVKNHNILLDLVQCCSLYPTVNTANKNLAMNEHCDDYQLKAKEAGIYEIILVKRKGKKIRK